MNVIEEMAVHPLVQSLGWTLLHFVWQGSLAAAAFAAVNALLRERSANLRYVTASTAMLLMTACVPVTFYLIYSSQSVSPVVGVEPAPSSGISEAPRTLDGDSQSQRTIHLPPAGGLGGVLNRQSPSGQAVTSIATNTARNQLRSLLPWIVGCWAIGVLVLSMRLLGGWAYMRILVRSRSRAASEQWCGTVDLLRKRLGIDRAVRLLETASLEVPVVSGWLRPALMLPVTAFTGLSPDQVEAILIHELAHIRRHDYLVNLLQTVAETLLFYHPAIWWISKRMRVEREYCCDDIASSQSKDTLTYVAALSQLEERRRVALNLAVAAAGGSLLERVRRLCNVSAPESTARRPGLLGLLVMVALVTAVASYTGQGSENASADAENSIEVTLKSGEQVEDIDFAARSIRLPKELVRAAAAYRELRGYRDSTTVVVFEESLGEETKRTTWMQVAFERPNKVRIETKARGRERVIVSDGLMLTDHLDAMWMDGQTQYTQQKASEKAIALDMHNPMAGLGGGVLFPTLVGDDPLKELMERIEGVEKVGHAKLDGTPVAVVELTVSASSLPEHVVPYASRMDMPIEMLLWIDQNDYLIRQLAFELNLKRMAEEVAEEHPWIPTKIALTERHTAIQVDPAFAEETFVFVPPEAAELVDRFGPPSASRDKSEFVGKPAPEFALKDIDNNQVALTDFEGQVLILDFWATWGGPCRQEMPTFVVLQDQYEADGFSVIGIAIRDTAEEVREYASNEELNFPLLMADDKVGEDYGHIWAIPTTFVIDKQGMVRYTYVGSPPDLLVFQQHVEELLTESL